MISETIELGQTVVVWSRTHPGVDFENPYQGRVTAVGEKSIRVLRKTWIGWRNKWVRTDSNFIHITRVID